MDLRVELDRLEVLLADLKVQYEQYFTGLLPLAPDKLHADVKRLIRTLLKAPFKNSALNYRLRAIKQRYSTYDTYWKRVLREREAGIYSKDVFKANLRDRNIREDAKSATVQGAAEKHMHALFQSYKTALEKNSGNAVQVDFESFRDSLVKRAKSFKQKHGGKKLSFKVVVKDGKVTVQAQVKE